MACGTGKQDWDVSFGNERVLDKNRLRIAGSNKPLEERLSQAQVLEAIAGMGNMVIVRYSADQKIFDYIEDICPRLAPPPERFQPPMESLTRRQK